MIQGAGCVSRARPDLWGVGKSNPPHLPDQPAKNCHGGINNKNLATFSTEGGLVFSIFFGKMEN